MTFDPAILRPGDCLLYKAHDLVTWLIGIKTWSPNATHVEIYLGDGWTFTSRLKTGVRRYQFDPLHLSVVRRPMERFDLAKSMQWSTTVSGQPYDLLGLLCFFLAVKHGANGKQFCSEACTRFYRKGGFGVVQASIDADTVAPSEFWQSAALNTIYQL